jgi:hypothetical protein
MTLNHYRIVWNELALLSKQRPDMVAGRELERPDMVSERPDMVSERPDMVSERPDMVSERPDMVSERPDMVSAKPQEEVFKGNNNNWATADVVVVSLGELGIVDPERTCSMAREVLQLTDEQIMERIAHWRSLPADHPLRKIGPGVLHRWLTRPRSWHTPNSEPPKLQLRKLGNCTDENRRAELIRYGRSKHWTHQQLQAAVVRFEDECLQSGDSKCVGVAQEQTTPKEELCQPQPESRDRNQIALVRTQKPLRQEF